MTINYRSFISLFGQVDFIFLFKAHIYLLLRYLFNAVSRVMASGPYTHQSPDQINANKNVPGSGNFFLLFTTGFAEVSI